MEKAICSDERLSKLDDILAIVYHDAITGSVAEKDLKGNQHKWLLKRNACNDHACIKNAYESRLEYLRSGISKNVASSNLAPQAQTHDPVKIVPSQPDAHPSSVEVSLRRFLQTFDRDKRTQYVAAFQDLNGDGTPEAIVYLMGNWCGSGGCTTLILTQEGSAWRIVTKITITRPPIRVLANISHGWHSIAIWVQGGGIQPGYEAELLFNGKTYPRNPSVPPARRLEEKLAGEVVIPTELKGVSLYDD